MATKKREGGSTLDKAVQFTVRLSERDWEVARRLAGVLYAGRVRYFVARAIVEKTIAGGGMKSPAKALPMPQETRSLDEALENLAQYQRALAERLTESKAFHLRKPTRSYLAKLLTRFPQARDDREPFEPPPLAKPTSVENPEHPGTFALPPLQLTAAKGLAAKSRDGSFTTFVIEAIREKADDLGMRSPKTDHPTFRKYPAIQLLKLQRHIEEPALALISAHDEIDQRLRAAGRKPSGALLDAATSSGLALFEELFDIKVEDDE